MRLELYLVVATLIVSTSTVVGQPADAIDDAFPNPIPFGTARATLAPFATIPLSDGAQPRMTQLRPAYDGSGRLFLNDQRGPLYVITPDGASITLYLDVRNVEPMITGGFSGGFHNFAFHPEFATNGKLYTFHGSNDVSQPLTYANANEVGYPGSVHGVLLEWTADDPTSDVFQGPAPRTVLRVEQQLNGHSGGGLSFDYSAAQEDPEYGILYMTFGDGTLGEDLDDAAQNPRIANGKCLRLDPVAYTDPTTQDFRPFRIPNDNPFIDDAGVLDIIYAMGLRNTQRVSFDPAGIFRTPILADIGQGVIEEINLGVSGANYGWVRREGTFEYVQDRLVRSSPTPPEFTDPVAEYDHTEGIPNSSTAAITPGTILRGPSAGALEGAFIFGDIAGGRIFYIRDFETYTQTATGGQDAIRELRLLDESGQQVDLRTDVLNSPRADLRFGVAPDGAVFILNKRDGVLRTLTISKACGPADLSSTGATLPNQAGFALPDGRIDLDDLGYFLGRWLASAQEADLTTTGATLEGTTGFGVPDGVVDLDDLGWFISVWLSGCS
ncbi:MAG: PQQ-dependent sugar dehydrogenase [Planctomycetota bacterium]